VYDEVPTNIALLQQHFMRVDEQVTVVPIVRRGKIVRRFYVVRCYDFLSQPLLALRPGE
jgi:hypothetical protein